MYTMISGHKDSSQSKTAVNSISANKKMSRLRFAGGKIFMLCIFFVVYVYCYNCSSPGKHPPWNCPGTLGPSAESMTGGTGKSIWSKWPEMKTATCVSPFFLLLCVCVERILPTHTTLKKTMSSYLDISKFSACGLFCREYEVKRKVYPFHSEVGFEKNRKAGILWLCINKKRKFKKRYSVWKGQWV